MSTGIGSVQSDIHQAGVLLYRAANGDPFFQQQVPETDGELEARTLQGVFPDRDKFQPHVPLKLRQVIRKALSVDPQERYQSATEMADDLGHVAPFLDWTMTDAESKTIWSASRAAARACRVAEALLIDVVNVEGRIGEHVPEAADEVVRIVVVAVDFAGVPDVADKK